MTSKFSLYAALYPLARGDRPSLRRLLSRGLRHLSDRLIRALTTTDEPKICKIGTKDGQVLFDAYDPVTKDHIRAVSAENIYVWLEERYYK